MVLSPTEGSGKADQGVCGVLEGRERGGIIGVLELDMRAQCRNQHRAAVAVVAGVRDVLHTGSEVNAAPGVDCVVRLDDILAAIVQFAIAENEAKAAIGEVGLVIFANCVGDECDSSAVLLAMPPYAMRPQSSGEGLIDFGVGEGFGLAVIPAEAAERGQIVGEILLNVDAETILAIDVPGMVRDLRNRSETFFKVSDGRAIDAHVGVISEGQEADYSRLLRDNAGT